MENTSPTTQNFMCSICHQPVAPEFYFCPNCGKDLKEKPLSTTAFTQFGIYTLSIILPMICFLAIRYWPVKRYVRSNDPKARLIGFTAIILAILSTIFIVWTAYSIMEGLSKALTADIGNIGKGLGGF